MKIKIEIDETNLISFSVIGRKIWCCPPLVRHEDTKEVDFYYINSVLFSISQLVYSSSDNGPKLLINFKLFLISNYSLSNTKLFK